MNNKTLAIAFGALLLIYLLSKLLGGNRERSFDPKIIDIDTSAVDRIVVHPAAGDEMFELSKTGSGWQLKRSADLFQATAGSVGGLLSNLSQVQADRIVSKNPDRHKDYAVDEGSGTRIELYGGQKKLGDVVVGRFNFNQATRSGISYLKKYDEDEVYSVEGFLSMSLTQGFENYRNKVLTSLTAGDLTKITLEDRDDNLVILKSDSLWRDPSGLQVDSASVAGYLSTVQSVTGGTFINTRGDVGERLKTLKIEGNNLPESVTINCYASQDTSHHFVIHSSANSEGYFFSDSNGIYSRFFEKFPGQ